MHNVRYITYVMFYTRSAIKTSFEHVINEVQIASILLCLRIHKSFYVLLTEREQACRIGCKGMFFVCKTWLLIDAIQTHNNVVLQFLHKKLHTGSMYMFVVVFHVCGVNISWQSRRQRHRGGARKAARADYVLVSFHPRSAGSTLRSWWWVAFDDVCVCVCVCVRSCRKRSVPGLLQKRLGKGHRAYKSNQLFVLFTIFFVNQQLHMAASVFSWIRVRTSRRSWPWSPNSRLNAVALFSFSFYDRSSGLRKGIVTVCDRVAVCDCVAFYFQSSFDFHSYFL